MRYFIKVLHSVCLQYVSGYELPDWVMVNDTLDRLLALRDIYASSPPQEVAYLRGGRFKLGWVYVGRSSVCEWL